MNKDYFISQFREFGKVYVNDTELHQVLRWIQLDLRIFKFSITSVGFTVWEISKI